jgi:hypothetical protein
VQSFVKGGELLRHDALRVHSQPVSAPQLKNVSENTGTLQTARLLNRSCTTGGRYPVLHFPAG